MFVIMCYRVAPIKHLTRISALSCWNQWEFFPLAHSQDNKDPNSFAMRQSEIVIPMIY